jgi:heat shock protein 90kDa beta
VADSLGYTANVERVRALHVSFPPFTYPTTQIQMLNAQNKKKENDWMFEFGKRQRILEINPRSPLIEGLLRRIEQLPGPEEEKDLEAEDELKEVVSILVDGALVRSGFEVADSNQFLTRIDRVLRRSLGVSETAQTDTTVTPAPEPREDEEPPAPVEEPGANLKLDIEEIDADEESEAEPPHHDEL